MDGECFDLQWAVEFGSMGTLPTRAQSPRAAVASRAPVQVEALYLPLVMAALSGNKAGLFGIRHGPLGSLPMIHYRSSAADERFLLWRVLEHNSATVAFGEYQGILRKALATAPSRM